MISAPLFNKPALLIFKDGTIDIQRVNCRRIVPDLEEMGINLSSDAYNIRRWR